MTSFSRRTFLHAGSGAAAAALLPARGNARAPKPGAQSAPCSASEAAAPPFIDLPQVIPPPVGEPVRFASIGVGIEGSSLLRAAVTLPHGKCVAACDLYDARHTLAQEIAGTGITVTRRYHEILDDKNIEAVIVAVPDHWHKQITVDALAAGKDVYCEKPMSHSIAEGDEMVSAVKHSKNFVQVGSQRVSSVIFAKAKELYDSGVIGQAHEVELQLGRNSPGGAWVYPPPPGLSPENLDWTTWLGDAPKKPFDPITFARWRCWHEYGTGMAGDLMVHLLSGMQFATGINAIPDQAYSTGGIYRWIDGRNMPDLQMTTFRYGDVVVSVRLTQSAETPEMTRIMGPTGLIEVTSNSVILIPQQGVDRSPDYGLNGFPAAMHSAYEQQWHAEHDPWLAAHPVQPPTVWKGPSWDDMHPHLAVFFNAVRTRQPVAEDVVFGHHAAAACHMANRSYFEKQTILRPDTASA
jgi:predicted dehydrogenase